MVRGIQESLRRAEKLLHLKSEEMIKVIGDYEVACQSTMKMLTQRPRKKKKPSSRPE
jgi:hypothetical protein